MKSLTRIEHYEANLFLKAVLSLAAVQAAYEDLELYHLLRQATERVVGDTNEVTITVTSWAMSLVAANIGNSSEGAEAMWDQSSRERRVTVLLDSLEGVKTPERKWEVQRGFHYEIEWHPQLAAAS